MNKNKQHTLKEITVDGRECVAITLCAPLKKRYHGKFIYLISKKLTDEFGDSKEKKCQIVADELLEKEVDKELGKMGIVLDAPRDKLQEQLYEEQREKLRQELRDPSSDYQGKITRSILPVQLEDQPEKVVIPKAIWQLLSKKEQGEFVNYIRTTAEKMTQEKYDARLCLDFLDEVKKHINGEEKEDTEPHSKMEHYRSGVWLNQHHITYIIPIKKPNQQKITKLEEKMHDFISEHLNEIAPARTFKGAVNVDERGEKARIVVSLDISDEELVPLLKDEGKRELLFYALTHPKYPKQPEPREPFNVKCSVQEQREKINAGKRPPERMDWDTGEPKRRVTSVERDGTRISHTNANNRWIGLS